MSTLSRSLAAASVLAFLSVPSIAGVAAPPTITLGETIDAFGSGNYEISIDSQPGSPFFIAAFAVENDTATFASSTYNEDGPGGAWSADILSRETWDGCDIEAATCFGYDVEYGTPGGSQVLFNTLDIGDFETVFGSDAFQAVLYWAGNYIQYSDVDSDFQPDGLIGPDETADQFDFFALAVESNYIVVNQNGFLIASGDIGATAVPEPEALALLGLALAGLGLARRRRTA
jgi:hypothetical protein